MSFAQDIAKLPNNARNANAQGFLPPVLRTFGHLLYVLGHTAVEEPTMTDEELLAELTHAREHWNAADPNSSLSAPTAKAVTDFGTALESAIDEWEGWDRDTRIRNVRELANKTVSLSVIFDRELVGLRTSDAGYTL